MMNYYLNELKMPGMAALVMNADGITREGYYGEMDKGENVNTNTLFMLASVSKTVVVTAVLQLLEDGFLNLDDDISSILGYEVRNPYFQDTPITIKMLLQHKSSIHDRQLFYYSLYTIPKGGGDYEGSLDEFIQSYFSKEGKTYRKKNFNKYKPGTKTEYSNLAIAVLGVIVEKLTSLDFETYCQENIFKPLGMSNRGKRRIRRLLYAKEIMSIYCFITNQKFNSISLFKYG